MPRPKTKNELVELSQKNYKRLTDFIASFSPEEQVNEFPPGTMNRNIRDILGHLHHWHLLFLGWYRIGMQGEKPAMPAEGYTWKDNSRLNQDIHKKYVTVSLDEMKSLIDQSYNELQVIIQKHDDTELFEKKRYKWTGSTSLAAYLISATSSHYDWAFKLIKKAKK